MLAAAQAEYLASVPVPRGAEVAASRKFPTVVWSGLLRMIAPVFPVMVLPGATMVKNAGYWPRSSGPP